jgi:transcriptional regulator with XRE-family HTH domain
MPPSQPAALTPSSFTSFGDLLRFLRRRAQLTQRDLGMAVGYNFAQICRLEQGQRLPDGDVVAAVFVPALSLEEAPEWATRLIELAGAARPKRRAALAVLPSAPASSQDDETLSDTDALEAIPAPAPYEVSRLRLVARLHACLVAERRVALVGLAGMGKTTLAAALAREYSESTPVFWLTFTSGVTTSVEAIVRHLALFLLAHGQAQARALLRRTGQDSTTLPLDQQLSLIAAALSQLAGRDLSRRGTPPLLCFDNAHLAQEDDDIVRVLRHLSATTPARLLLTSREHLQALPGCPLVRLDGLNVEEGLELIAQLRAHVEGATQAPAWAAGLLEKTGGSPMLLQLALGELADSQIEPAALIAGLESQPQIASYLLETVRRHVSPTAWGLLALISVFRQPVNLHDPALIELIQEADAAYDLDAALDELAGRHLIDHPARAQPHPLVRDYAYTGLLRLPLHRRQLHRIAAEWSEQGLGDPVEASYHYGQAGDLAAAAAALADNVEAIGRRGAAFVAADIAEGLLIQARRQRNPDRWKGGDTAETVRRLLMVRSDLLVHTLRAQEAEASYREALALTNASDERARIACRLAQSLTQRGQAAEAVRICQEALAALGGAEYVLRAQLRAAESQAQLVLPNHAAATAAATEALALADQLDGGQARPAAEVRVRAHRVLGAIAHYALDLDAALAHLRSASRVAEQSGLSELAWRCRTDEASLLFSRGEISAAIGRCEAILPQLRAIGDSYALGQLYGIMTLSYLLHDDLAAGLAAAEQGYAMREEIGDRQGMVMAANQRALLLIALDRLVEARDLVARTLALEELTGDMYELGFALEKLAILQMLEGDVSAAQVTLRRALELPATANDAKLRDDLLHGMAVAQLMRGAVDEAQAILEAQTEGGGLWVELDYRLLAALIALARGELAAARAAADDLANRAREVGYSIYERKAHWLAAAAPPSNYARLAWVIGAR